MDNTLYNDCAGALTTNVWETPPRRMYVCIYVCIFYYGYALSRV